MTRRAREKAWEAPNLPTPENLGTGHPPVLARDSAPGPPLPSQAAPPALWEGSAQWGNPAAPSTQGRWWSPRKISALPQYSPPQSPYPHTQHNIEHADWGSRWSQQWDGGAYFASNSNKPSFFETPKYSRHTWVVKNGTTISQQTNTRACLRSSLVKLIIFWKAPTTNTEFGSVGGIDSSYTEKKIIITKNANEKWASRRTKGMNLVTWREGEVVIAKFTVPARVVKANGWNGQDVIDKRKGQKEKKKEKDSIERTLTSSCCAGAIAQD